MNRYLIIAQSDVTAKALRSILKLVWPESLDRESDAPKSDDPQDVKSVIMGKTGLPPDQQFDHIAGRICTIFAEAEQKISVGETTILVDRLNLDNKSSPLSSSGWDATVGMLILAFPEVRWIFGVLEAKQEDAAKQADFGKLYRWHSIAGFLCEPYADPLFDGSGLRNAIRQLIKDEKSENRALAPFVPIRNHTAAALDDEESYAYFNAYTAYRFGFRAFPVFRNTLAVALFKDPQSKSFTPCLTFEDVYLSYPDNVNREHYSDLGSDDGTGRKMRLPGLERSSYRIFVTTEHRHAGDGGKHGGNLKYIKSGDCVKESDGPRGYGRIVNKPYSGMFALRHQAWLDRRLRWSDEKGRDIKGVAEGYVWPPVKATKDVADTGHSAPGRLLQVATHMLNRCESLLRAGVHTVPEAVRCAVLATDALELLGDRTPTTAMDALKLKHMAEVNAECQFSGVEYHIEMRLRLEEIQKESRCLSRWFSRRRQVMAAMNAEMTTLIEMMRILRDHGQFDEALVCQNRVRFLHNRLWMCQLPVRFVFWPLLKYIEVILASFSCFLAAIVLWMLGFVGGFAVLTNKISTAKACLKDAKGLNPWEQAFTAFTGANGFTSVDFMWNILTVLAVIVGIAHIGVFISHVYMLVSRKD
jgi:hypothetical protein